MTENIKRTRKANKPLIGPYKLQSTNLTKYYIYIIAVGVIIGSYLTGCSTILKDKEDSKTCLREREKLLKENHTLKEKLADLTYALELKEKQLANITAKQDLTYLPKIVELKLGRLTGPIDKDNDGFDDTIVVYIKPLDSDGDPIKVTGSATIKLVSLEGKNPRILSEITLGPEELHKMWINGLMSSYYKVYCPLKKQDSKRITTLIVYVNFTELSTGREFAAEKLCKVNLQPAK